MKRSIQMILSGMLLVLACGCSSFNTATINRQEFDKLYEDKTAITDVWYMGTDASYHHFCMEHWTLKPDGSDAKLDNQKFYQVPISELHMNDPFPVVSDVKNQEKWRLLRPNLGPNGV